jgi:hypothetical protein
MKPRTQLPSGARRLLALVALPAVLALTVGGRASEYEAVFGQKLTNPYLSSGLGPGKPLQAAYVEAGYGEMGKLSHPYLASWYDGLRNLPLAICSARAVTEQDLVLFRWMKREPDPDLFQKWEKGARPLERQELLPYLDDGLRKLAYTLVLAEQAPSRPLSATEEKFIRFLKYPVYQLVWIDKVLRPSLNIQPIDLIKYYHDHAGDYYKPESVKVRYVFRAVPKTATIAEREQAEKETRALRERAVAGENFVELARRESNAPSAVRGGELPAVYRGMFVEEFESQAFALKPGQISPVFWGPEGLYFIQCLERRPEEQISFKDAEKDLLREVAHQTLQYLYEYRLKHQLRLARYRALPQNILVLPPNGELIAAGDYRLSKNEFLDMFPHAITEPIDLDLGVVGALCRDILEGELIAQEIERRGFGNDPLLLAADKLARQIWRANVAIRVALEVPLKFTEPELRGFYDKNLARVGYQPQWHVLEIDASVTNPYLRHPSQLKALQAELHTQFQLVLRDFLTAFREERSRQAEELVLAGEAPPKISVESIPVDQASTATLRFQREMMRLPRSIQVISDASTSDYQFTVRVRGYRDLRDKEVYAAVKDLREGDFSDIKDTSEGVSYCYFVERYIPGAPAGYDQIRVHVRQAYIAAQQAEALERLRAGLERRSAFRVQLPEIGSQPE